MGKQVASKCFGQDNLGPFLEEGGFLLALNLFRLRKLGGGGGGKDMSIYVGHMDKALCCLCAELSDED